MSPSASLSPSGSLSPSLGISDSSSVSPSASFSPSASVSPSSSTSPSTTTQSSSEDLTRVSSSSSVSDSASASPSEELPLIPAIVPVQKAIFFKNSYHFHRPMPIKVGLKRMSATISPFAPQQQIPMWNNAGRPKKAKEGVLGFNIELHCLEYFDGSVWQKLPMEKLAV